MPPWEKYAQPVASAPAGDPIIKPVDPTKAAEEIRAAGKDARDARIDNLNAQLAELSIAEKTRKEAEEVEKAEAANRTKSDATSKLRNVIDKIDQVAVDAADNDGWGETGWTGSVMRQMAGTPGYDLAADVQTIDANSAFEALAEMRRNSPTGGALGQVTEKELDLLKSSVSNLDTKQSQGHFIKNLADAKRIYMDMLERMEPGSKAALSNRKGIRYKDDGTPMVFFVEGEDDRDPTVLPLESDGDSGDDSGSAPPPPGSDPGGGSNEPRSLFGNTMADIDASNGGLLGLARQGATLGLSDEAAGLGGFIGGLFTGENPVEAYRRENSRVDAQNARAREASPVLGTATEFLGGGAAARVPNALMSIGSAAKTGAALGGVGGYGYGEGAVGSAGNALLGVGAGAGLGAAGQWAGNALAARSATRAADRAIDPEIVAAGQRQQVPVRGPDVRKDMRLRRSELRGSESAGQRIRDAEIEDIAAIEGAVDRNLGGAAINRTRAGDAAQEGVQAARKGMKDKASRLYDQAHALSGRARVTPGKAIEVIDRNIAQLEEAGSKSNKTLIKYLNDVREDLTKDGGLTVEALRNQRTNMRGQINERSLSATDAERRMGQVLDAAADDIGAGLSGRPEALKKFREGDAIWRDRAKFTKQIGEKLLGPRDNPLSPDTTASRLENWVSSDFRRARDLWTRLDSAAQDDIRSHIAGNLGRNQRGDFSLEFFLKHTGGGKNAAISDKSARLIFGEDGMSAIRDLRALSQAKVNAGAATNRSETSTAMRRGMTGLRHVLLTGMGFAAGDFTGAVVAPIAGGVISRLGEQRAARMLLNPDFTKWLRNAPNTASPAAIDRYFGKLGSIPSIAANDNAAFQRAIRDGFGSRIQEAGRMSGPAAAQDEQDRREK